jgi:site-specific recombinase XerD
MVKSVALPVAVLSRNGWLFVHRWEYRQRCYTNLLPESGTDLRYIQELLGYNSSRTTEIYTHVSQHNLQQIRSPFDYL